MDDFHQRIILTLDHQYFWREPRITVNQSHPFWEASRSSLALNGDFVEKCLWTPDMIFTNTHSIETFNPTPTEHNGPSNKYSLDRNGNVHVWMRDAAIKVSCTLDLKNYPFDKQV